MPTIRSWDFWTKEDDDLLKRVYPCQTAEEIQKLFPNRTPDAISARASRDLHLKKDTETHAMIQSMNSSKLGIANFADHPLEALARKNQELPEKFISVRFFLKQLIKEELEPMELINKSKGF